MQGLISKMIQVLLVDYKPSLSTLKNVVDGIQSMDSNLLSIDSTLVAVCNMFSSKDL
ncbi:hypothetical protein ACVNPX_10430 [Staphylococcus aureus]